MPDCWESEKNNKKKKKIQRLDSVPSCACLVVQPPNYMITYYFSPGHLLLLDHRTTAYRSRVESGLGNSQSGIRNQSA